MTSPVPHTDSLFTQPANAAGPHILAEGEDEYCDSDDEFFLGFSARSPVTPESSQGTATASDLATPPSSLPGTATQYEVDLFPDDTVDQLPSSVGLTATQQPLSRWRDEDTKRENEAQADAEEDDGAVLARLLEQHRQRLNAEFAPAVPTPRPPSPQPPEPVAPTDPLDLFFLADHGDDHDMDLSSMVPRAYVPAAESSLAIEEERSRRRIHAVHFLESLTVHFLRQLNISCKRARRHYLGADQLHRGRRGQSGLGRVAMLLTSRATGLQNPIVFPDEPGTVRDPALLRISRVLVVASILYDVVLTHGLVTKRDIYYRDVQLFQKQNVVDKIVDDLVATAGLKRQDFRVCATSKGIFASNALEVELVAGGRLKLASATPMLIPREEEIADLIAVDGIDWVLVVEKDAVMQTLCGARLLDDARPGPGVLVTGKGYPDLTTQQLLRRLADTFPSARMYALVDADPHGIQIMSTYVNGSHANRFSEDYIGLPLGERLQWLGVRATEWSRLGQNEDLLPLGKLDTRLALAMCNRPDLDPEWRRELSHMLHLRRKAEIQILCGPPANGAEIAQHVGDASGKARNRLVEYIVSRIARR